MQKSFLQKTWVVAGVAFLCSALWGSAFAGVKIGYELFQIASADWAAQMVFAGIRFAIAGVMALVGGSIVAKQALIPQKQTIPKISIISLFQTILQYFFYYIGLAHTTGVNAAIIVAANVFIAILLSTLVYRIEKMTAAKLFGCVIGFLGIILCNLNGLKGGIHLSFLGDGFIFLCTVASGFSSVLMKKYAASENPILLSGWQFLFGGVVMFAVGLLFGGRMEHITGSAIAILLYLSFVSAAAYSLWSLLLKYNPVSKVAVFGFLNPICGVCISTIFLKEKDAFHIFRLCGNLYCKPQKTKCLKRTLLYRNKLQNGFDKCKAVRYNNNARCFDLEKSRNCFLIFYHEKRFFEKKQEILIKQYLYLGEGLWQKKRPLS